MVRRLIPDYDFIMDVDDSFIDNFVNVPSGIPNLLMDFLEKRDNDVTHKRFLTFKYSDLLRKAKRYEKIGRSHKK